MDFLTIFAKSKLGILLMGWIFAHGSFILPLKRLHETKTMLAFHHPKPSYPIHILLVPKKAIGSPANLDEGDHDFLMDVFQITKQLVEEFSLEESGYRLILNGGKYQQVPQLHFHLVAGEKAIASSND